MNKNNPKQCSTNLFLSPKLPAVKYKWKKNEQPTSAHNNIARTITKNNIVKQQFTIIFNKCKKELQKVLDCSYCAHAHLIQGINQALASGVFTSLQQQRVQVLVGFEYMQYDSSQRWKQPPVRGR